MRVLFGAIRKGPFFLYAPVPILHGRSLLPLSGAPSRIRPMVKGRASCTSLYNVRQSEQEKGRRLILVPPCRRPLPMVIRFQAGEVFAFVIPFSPLPVHSSSPTHFPFCGVFPPIGRKWFSHSMQDGSMQELLSIAYDRLALWFELQIKPCRNWPGLRSFSSRTNLYLASRARV